MLAWLMRSLLLWLVCGATFAAAPVPLPASVVDGLGASGFSERLAAVESLAVLGADADPVVTALEDGRLGVMMLPDDHPELPGRRVAIRSGDQFFDLATGQVIAEPGPLAQIRLNNRLRRALSVARAGIELSRGDDAARLAAAETLSADASEMLLPLFERVMASETNAEVRGVIERAAARVRIGSADPAVRLAAVESLGASYQRDVLTLLTPLAGDAEPDAAVRAAAVKAIADIERRLSFIQTLRTIFTGMSLGSILLLAALGLAITFGVMGVINMAHGELLMVGAYATFLVQGAFRAYLPDAFDYYVIAAIPAAFLAAALVGVVMERSVLRYLYGRPLESLLATWGLSLILIQGARVLFGPQNLELTNPSWLSGSVEVIDGLVLPWNRIVILGFAALVLIMIWLMMQKTRLGMFVRAVTQNRPMASCVGVPTGQVDTLAFAIGAGVAGLGGLALSQIANVGPAMGQGYIVDSFMVVVLGGVGQLAGAVWAALGLGVVTKILEGWSGAVIAKILVLVFIIIFIQKRPQGLFALKGRFADN